MMEKVHLAGADLLLLGPTMFQGPSEFTPGNRAATFPDSLGSHDILSYLFLKVL